MSYGICHLLPWQQYSSAVRPSKTKGPYIYNYTIFFLYKFFFSFLPPRKPFWACLIYSVHPNCRHNTLCEVTQTYLIILQQNVENWITPHCFVYHLSIPNTRGSMKNKSCTFLAKGCAIKPSHVLKNAYKFKGNDPYSPPGLLTTQCKINHV